MRHIRVDAIPDLSDTQVIVYTRWDRSPDIVEDQVTYPIITVAARRAESENDPRLQRFRLQLRVRHLSGRHRHLLGAQPCGRIPAEDRGQSAGRRHALTRSRRDRRGLGVPVRAGRQVRKAQPRRPAQFPGLESALRAAIGSGCGGSGGHRRIPEAVPGHHRSQPAAELRPEHSGSRGRDPALEQRSRRTPDRMERARVHGARARVHSEHGSARRTWWSKPARRERPCFCATWPPSRSVRRFAAVCRISMATATPSAASSSCATGKTRATSSRA